MTDWTSIATMGFLAAVLLFGWVRGWSMMLTLSVAMAGAFVTGVATAPRISDSIVGSPLMADLAWRPSYFAPDAWMHWHTAITTMFLHADVAHIFINIVIFAFMGIGFEERLGRGRFLLVFVVSGLVGTVIHTAAEWGSSVPVVGASGAVFGIIGAYATAFPRDRVVLFLFLIIPNVPVYIAAVAYTALELIALEATGSGGSVARFAHLGGIAGGVFLALALTKYGGLERGERRPKALGVEGLGALVSTENQKRLYEKVVANKDEPDIANAWLEKLARETPCPECGEPLEAVGGSLRSACGYRLRGTSAADAD